MDLICCIMFIYIYYIRCEMWNAIEYRYHACLKRFISQAHWEPISARPARKAQSIDLRISEMSPVEPCCATLTVRTVVPSLFDSKNMWRYLARSQVWPMAFCCQQKIMESSNVRGAPSKCGGQKKSSRYLWGQGTKESKHSDGDVRIVRSRFASYGPVCAQYGTT